MLVRESIGFERYRDPKSALGLSIRPEIEEWLEKNKIKHLCKINDNNTIDCINFFTLTEQRITELPEFIRFNIASDGFSVSKNRLTTLRGCPKIVKGDFYCYSNALKTLEFAPEEVGGDFYCENNAVLFTEDEVRAACKVEGRINVIKPKW